MVTKMIFVILGIIMLVAILILSTIAIVRGFKGMKISKSFEDNKKISILFWLVSLIHMLLGLIITLSYVIAVVLIITNI